ncbi:ATP synthase subunit B family protein [Anaplasma centrale]|uniref:hypothetical protein n=1 Tax=Anaplasma centrale TaxID=769 RepID=UPI001EE5A256|nr:hypothetical protein [Anaplasma centrale]
MDFSMYPSQVAWFSCAFFLLYLAVRWAVPRVEGIMGKRYAAASKSLEDALGVCGAIELRLLRQRKALEDADLGARDAVEGALAEVSSCTEEARSLLSEEVCAMFESVEQRLGELRRDVHGELVDLSAEVAFMYYTKVRGCDEAKRDALKKLAARLYEGKL